MMRSRSARPSLGYPSPVRRSSTASSPATRATGRSARSSSSRRGRSQAASRAACDGSATSWREENQVSMSLVSEMTKSQGYEEERLGQLLAALPPAPEGWVQAAQELPGARRELDEIVARAEADLAFREALVVDLEAALAAEGYEPAPRVLDELRRRYSRN